MDYIRAAHHRETYAETRQAAYEKRARKARRWACLVIVLIAGAWLTAAWQDRALSPQVHDGLNVLAGHVQSAIDNSDGAGGFIRDALDFPTAGSGGPEHDPITRWLLKWTN